MQLSIILLEWYDSNRRTFPWREKNFASADDHAFHTWICEVMSQQTLISVLLPKYKQFLIEVPTLAALAECSEDKLRDLWKGLGYYARARNLQKGAQYILSDLKGVFPTTQEGWLKVPGCGAYTSSIVASICYKEPIVAVDGNVIRVASRLLNIQDTSIWKPEGTKRVFSFFQEYISQNRPGDMNQALMDFGATVCKKHNPICDECPLQSYCAAYKQKTTHLCPPVKPRKTPVLQEIAAFVMQNPQNKNKVFLFKREEGFLKKTLGFPLLKQTPFSWKNISSLLQNAGWKAKLSAQKFKHSITHHKIEGYVILLEPNDTHVNCVPLETIFDLKGECYWIAEENIETHLSSSLDQKIFKIWHQQEHTKWGSGTLFDL